MISALLEQRLGLQARRLARACGGIKGFSGAGTDRARRAASLKRGYSYGVFPLPQPGDRDPPGIRYAQTPCIDRARVAFHVPGGPLVVPGSGTRVVVAFAA
eukprot:3163269-Rhodomonas_salina.1